MIFCKINIYDAVEIVYLSSFLSFSHWLSLIDSLSLSLSLSFSLSLSLSLFFSLFLSFFLSLSVCLSLSFSHTIFSFLPHLQVLFGSGFRLAWHKVSIIKKHSFHQLFYFFWYLEAHYNYLWGISSHFVSWSKLLFLISISIVTLVLPNILFLISFSCEINCFRSVFVELRELYFASNPLNSDQILNQMKLIISMKGTMEIGKVTIILFLMKFVWLRIAELSSHIY